MPGSHRVNRDFGLFFAAAAVSKLGTQVSYLAIPVLALTSLDASPGEVGTLTALSAAAALVIGLPAGAWVERMRKRRTQIVTDLARALLLASIPVGWWLGWLTMWQLYLTVLLTGVATVFFDVAAQSFLPEIVRRDFLITANARLGSADAVSNVAGRSLAGFLMQWLAAPIAVLVDAGSYLWSAIWLLRVRHRESAPTVVADRRLGRAIGEGLRFVGSHPILRPLALAGVCTNLSVQIILTMIPLVFVSELKLSTGMLGLFLSAGGVGAFFGAMMARRLGGWLGNGRAMWIVGLASVPWKLVIPLIERGPMLWLAAFGWMLTTFQVGINNVLQVSFRQRVTPDGLLGRMNATMRFLFTGAVALGAAVSGLVAEYASIRTALWAGAIGLALVWVPPFLSPLRGMRDLPD